MTTQQRALIAAMIHRKIDEDMGHWEESYSTQLTWAERKLASIGPLKIGQELLSESVTPPELSRIPEERLALRLCIAYLDTLRALVGIATTTEEE